MIKNTELRIGNLVSNDGVINTIENLLSDGMCTLKTPQGNYIKARYELLKGVELTSELAMRLGFKRFESDGVVGFDTFEPEEKTIWYEIEKFTLVQWGENTEFYFSGNNLRIMVKYVHKLQNLFFEHTGIELQLSST